MTLPPQVWIPDTSALMTLAAHKPLGDDVRDMFVKREHNRLLVSDVFRELESKAASTDRASHLARAALTELDWLGPPVELTNPDLVRATEIQRMVAGGREPLYPLQHWGEAAILSLCEQLVATGERVPVFLSDDHDARVAAKTLDITQLSIHKLLHIMIKRGLMTSRCAQEHAQALNLAGRSTDFTEQELIAGKLGRVGKP